MKSHFLQLISHGWFTDCKTNLPVPKWVEGDKKKFLQSRKKMDMCYYLAYTPVLDAPYYSIESKKHATRIKLKRQCINQLLPVVLEMHKHGYSHNDIHQGNIMFKGNKWFLIDYGLVGHRSWKTSQEDKREGKKDPKNDIRSLIRLSIDSPIKELAWRKKRFKPNSLKKVVKIIRKSRAGGSISKLVSKFPKKYHTELTEIFCEVHYFDIFKQAFGAHGLVITPSEICVSKKHFKLC